MLDIYAGKTALETIQEQGFSENLFTTMLGASGGPKWFTLFGLDKYLFSHFFNKRTQPLNMVGSSAGAFRAACFGQKNPVDAIERLALHYSNTVYSTNKPTAAEITLKALDILDITLGKNGIDEIINNPIVKSHFIVAKCNGLVSFEHKLLQSLGLASSLVRNFIDRKHLRSQYQRYVFAPASSNLVFEDKDNFLTQTVNFTESNLKNALLASGSIPLVMEGIKDIANCEKGMYRDGGIIDYHFDLKFKNQGLVLYPHFSSKLRSGWFDKNLDRHVTPENYDNAVVICPSEAFVQNLPNNKIPDREDFTKFDAKQRIKNWQTVFSESEKLAESLHEFIENQQVDSIKSISQLINK